jgi:hypothetical protein
MGNGEICRHLDYSPLAFSLDRMYSVGAIAMPVTPLEIYWVLLTDYSFV